jgi:hypothetical protein
MTPKEKFDVFWEGYREEQVNYLKGDQRCELVNTLQIL